STVERGGFVAFCHGFAKNNSSRLLLPFLTRHETTAAYNGIASRPDVSSRLRMIDSSIVHCEFAGDRLSGLLAKAREGNQQQLGQLLQCYRSYLTVLASAHLDERLRTRVSPSDLVQEAMLGACRDFAQFRGCSEPELL